MKTTTINLNVYEVGDIIQFRAEDFRLVSKQRTIGETTRGMVVWVGQRMDKLFSYKLILADGKLITFTPQEQGREEYIGHADIGLLFGDKKTA